jgi:hypothetical protein
VPRAPAPRHAPCLAVVAQGRGTFWRSLALAAGGPQWPSGERGGDASIVRAGGAVVGARIVNREHLFPIPIHPSRRAFTMPMPEAHTRGTVASWLGVSGLPGSAVPELVWDATSATKASLISAPPSAGTGEAGIDALTVGPRPNAVRRPDARRPGARSSQTRGAQSESQFGGHSRRRPPCAPILPPSSAKPAGALRRSGWSASRAALATVTFITAPSASRTL